MTVMPPSWQSLSVASAWQTSMGELHMPSQREAPVALLGALRGSRMTLVPCDRRLTIALMQYIDQMLCQSTLAVRTTKQPPAAHCSNGRIDRDELRMLLESTDQGEAYLLSQVLAKKPWWHRQQVHCAELSGRAPRRLHGSCAYLH